MRNQVRELHRSQWCDRQLLLKTANEGKDPTPLLGLIELSARLNTCQVGFSFGTVHPDIKSRLSGKKKNSLQKQFELCSTLAGAGFFFFRDQMNQSSGCNKHARGSRALAGCAGWSVSEPDEHNRQANSGVGVLPLTHHETTTKDSKTETYNYDVFGESIGKTPEFFGYTGKPFDPQTKMYNYGYRDYTPKTARFSTIDPIRDGANWFAYVGQDPVNFVDPDGLQESVIGKIGSSASKPGFAAAVVFDAIDAVYQAVRNAINQAINSYSDWEYFQERKDWASGRFKELTPKGEAESIKETEEFMKKKQIADLKAQSTAPAQTKTESAQKTNELADEARGKNKFPEDITGEPESVIWNGPHTTGIKFGPNGKPQTMWNEPHSADPNRPGRIEEQEHVHRYGPKRGKAEVPTDEDRDIFGKPKTEKNERKASNY